MVVHDQPGQPDRHQPCRCTDLAGNGSNPMFLNANGQGTLQSLVRYVSNSGSDSTGDGSATKPFATIAAAANSIQAASSSGEWR